MNSLSDEQLLALAREGQSTAEDELARRYMRLVRICARPFFLTGGDSEDLLQEGMLGLLYAIREYNPEKGASFLHTQQASVRHTQRGAKKARPAE